MKLVIQRLRLLREDKGSFSLEASLIMPVIVVLTLTLLFMSLYVYQQVILAYLSSATAEKAAFLWDNSTRSQLDGLAQPGQSDGLYWRLRDDDMLSSLFQLTGSSEHTGVRLPLAAEDVQQSSGRHAAGGKSGEELAEGEAAASSRLLVQKLSAAARIIPAAYTGQIAYKRSFFNRQIQVQLYHPLKLGPLQGSLGMERPRMQAASTVVDPAEFIRSVDLVRYYTRKFGSDSLAAPRKQQAADILKGRMAN